MSRPKMTDEHRQQMRGQILDSAYKILITKGPEGITSRAIARHLDLTHMGLFTYFPNQTAILQALAYREQLKFLEKLKDYKQRAEHENIALVLEDMLIQFQQFARDNPNLFRLIWIGPEGEIPPHWMQPTIDLVAELIRKGANQDIFDANDAQKTALLVLGLVNMPYMLAVCGKISHDGMTAPLSREAVRTAMQYLHSKKENGLPTIPLKPEYKPGWAEQTVSTLKRWLNRLLKH